MIPITTFAGNSVAVFGLAASGLATVTALQAGGATVAAWDDSEAGRAAAEKARVPLVDLTTADWSAFAALVLAPGVPLTHPIPHWTVIKAQQETTRRLDVGDTAVVEVIGDIELFCRERNKLAPDAPFIAITGTNGKSTTTALIAHILREWGCDVQMGGNIGVPILALEPPADDRYYVIEMSSFQIDLTPSVNPTIGVLLNITPDHLDRHGPADDLDLAMRNYVAIKARLVDAAKLPVIGVDNGLCSTDDPCESIYRQLEAHDGKPALAFTREHAQCTNMVYFDPPSLHRSLPFGDRHCYDETLVDLTTALALRGSHNAQNAAAAFLACEWMAVPHDQIGSALKTFPGLPHRMEAIGRVGEVVFVNDSKATNADSTEKALASFPRDVFWILGGKPKNGGIESLRPYFPGVVKAYLIGAATDEFAATLNGDVAIVRCETLDVAVATAAKDASLHRNDEPFVDVHPVVLLSPACASYDQFANFEQRGEVFRKLVSALPEFVARTKPPTGMQNA